MVVELLWMVFLGVCCLFLFLVHACWSSREGIRAIYAMWVLEGKVLCSADWYRKGNRDGNAPGFMGKRRDKVDGRR